MMMTEHLMMNLTKVILVTFRRACAVVDVDAVLVLLLFLFLLLLLLLLLRTQSG